MISPNAIYIYIWDHDSLSISSRVPVTCVMLEIEVVLNMPGTVPITVTPFHRWRYSECFPHNDLITLINILGRISTVFSGTAPIKLINMLKMKVSTVFDKPCPDQIDPHVRDEGIHSVFQTRLRSHWSICYSDEDIHSVCQTLLRSHWSTCYRDEDIHSVFFPTLLRSHWSTN